MSILRKAMDKACIDELDLRDVSPQAKPCAMCSDVRPDVVARGLAGGQFSVEAICGPCLSGSTARAMQLLEKSAATNQRCNVHRVRYYTHHTPLPAGC